MAKYLSKLHPQALAKTGILYVGRAPKWCKFFWQLKAAAGEFFHTRVCIVLTFEL